MSMLIVVECVLVHRQQRIERKFIFHRQQLIYTWTRLWDARTQKSAIFLLIDLKNLNFPKKRNSELQFWMTDILEL
jgi:hypothetical protein